MSRSDSPRPAVADAEGTSAPGPSRSEQLATAASIEERKVIHEKFVERKNSGFDEECQAVARLLERGDREGLIAHGSRFASERAAAKAAAIRAGH